jgi:hypothetical protein
MYTIIGSDGNQYGPITGEQLRQWFQEGRVAANTQVQADGGSWKPFSGYPEFADLVGVGGAVTATGTTPPMPKNIAASGALNQPVRNYLVQSILVTLCCCLPLGIPAIVFAAQVNGKVAMGDLAGAMESSRKAKMFCWIAFGLGLVFNLIAVGLQLLGVLASAGAGMGDL